MYRRVIQEETDTRTRLTIAPFLKLFRYAMRHWAVFLILIVSLILTTFYDASFTVSMTKALINDLANVTAAGGDIGSFVIHVDLIFGIRFAVNFTNYAVIFLVSAVLRCVSIAFTFFFTNYLSMLIMNDLRKESFEKVQQLSFSYFDRTPTGWILARMQNDTSSVSEILGWGIIRLVWTSFEVIFLLATLFSFSWELGLVLLATTPIIIIATPIFQHYLLKFSRIARNAYSSFIRWLSECINGTATIKTLAIEGRTYEECADIVDDIRDKVRKRLTVQVFFVPVVNFTAALTSAILILLGSASIDVGDPLFVIDIGILIMFIRSVGEVYGQIADFTDLYSEFVANQANAEKIIALIEEKPELNDRPDVIEKYGTLFKPKLENYEKMIGDVEYRDVSFSYLKDTEVIHHLNLKIKAGTSVAIVGETGSGKTTIANLLCRFYEPSKGDILIDGKPTRDRSVGWLRHNIAYVQQDPFVFTGTFKDNIRYGKWEASEEEIEKAARIVDIDEFIKSRPEGYDTFLTDGGAELSLGQKQLVSFARAVLKDPRILILDEATSSIDTATEAKVQKAIKAILKNRTSIIIAHRLSTIVGCDRIILIEDGRIVEDGPHLELMAKKGRYFDLYMAQFKDLDLDTQLGVLAKEKELQERV